MHVALERVVVIGGSYAFLLLFAALTARALIFQPPWPSYRPGRRLLRVPAQDGTSLAAVHLVAPHAEFTILYFHGNGEDLGDVLPQLEALCAHGYSVFAFDYRGYGASPGISTERRAYADARAVCDYVIERLGVAPQRLVLYGRSLGAGPAIELALAVPVAGLVIEGGFTSAFRVVTRARLIPGDQFVNLEKIARVRCPTLVVHGTSDGTVPFAHGRELFEAATGAQEKSCLWVEGAGHNDVIEVAGERYWAALEDLVAKARTQTSRRE